MKLQSAQTYPLRWYDHILLNLIPLVAALIIKLLLLSCRLVKVQGKEEVNRALEQSKGGVVYVSWHQRMAYNAHYFGREHLTIMISQSRDGEYAARVAKKLGYINVRGSSTRGGKKALRELVQKIKAGAAGGMLGDGPVGPARVAKVGSIVIARNSGVPLVPVTCGYDRCWVLNSWDRYLIPKPFARIIVWYGEPVLIPSAVRGKEIEACRLKLEVDLNRITRMCDEYFEKQRPWRKSKKGLPEFGPVETS